MKRRTRHTRLITAKHAGHRLEPEYKKPLPPVTIVERIRTWRKDATVLRGYGDNRGADLLELLAAELENDLESGAAEAVDLARAVELTGYTRGHLRRLLIEGKLHNVGTSSKPAFLSSELPRKPRRRIPHPGLAPPALRPPSLRMQVARAVASGE